LISFFILAVTRRSSAPEEAVLLKRIAQRDEKAFERLYDLYAKLTYSLILSVVKKQGDAEDVLQEVFLQVWEKASTFDVSKGNAYAWLITLARNRAIDKIRSKDFRKQSRETVADEPELSSPGSEGNPLDSLVVDERAQIVKQALRQIPVEQREVLEIAYFGGYSQSEIASKFNLPLGTVKTRMRQGMKKLYSLLKERL